MESITDPKPNQVNDKRPFYSGFLFFAGVLLPAAAFGLELITRMCAQQFFDPMPTWWHTLFVFFVAATNFQTWRAISRNRVERTVWLGFANAVAIFIALFYTILFAPLLPVAVIGIVLALLGLLPLAPLFSLIAALLMRRDLRRMSGSEKPLALRWKGLAAGFLLVFLAIGLAEMTFTLTKIGIEKASSDSPEKQTDGLNFIRRYGDENYLLRLCYSGSRVATTDFLFNASRKAGFFNDDVTEDASLTEKARKTFYRLNGADYRTAAPPRGVREWERNNFNEQTDQLTTINQGLSLSSSQIDGSIDGDAALAYLEWTLVLKNEKSWQQEGVAQIQLPPGAAVSRLTLWINGEEREAAFARKGLVTDAYNAVASKRKDPVLITTSGKDRVSMRAFPVPENGEMKIRIGITAPLELENKTAARLPMPYFQERNFEANVEHSVWFESKKPLEIANPNFVQERLPKFFAVRGRIKNDDLLKLGSPIRAIKSPDVVQAWARDKNDAETVVTQQIRESSGTKPERIIFVVDTSNKMKDSQNEIAETVKNFSFEQETALVLTGGNGLNADTAAPHAFVGSPAQIATRIENARFGGGADGVAAIEKAWDLAQEKPNGAIVWIHAPQPFELASTQSLIQMWTRRAGSPAVYSLQTKLGRDAIERKLGELNVVETVPRFGGLGEDLRHHLSGISRQKRSFEFVRIAESANDFKPLTNAKETSAHLVRLWAKDEVERRLAGKSPEDEKAALDLAVKYQLVTSVSGAVVLETQAQYDQFGLRPVDANTVPTIPEPEEYLLFGVVLSLIIWLFWQFRRQKLQTI